MAIVNIKLKSITSTLVGDLNASSTFKNAGRNYLFRSQGGIKMDGFIDDKEMIHAVNLQSVRKHYARNANGKYVRVPKTWTRTVTLIPIDLLTALHRATGGVVIFKQYKHHWKLITKAQ